MAIKKYQNLSLLFGAPGLIMQITGMLVYEKTESKALALIIAMLGTIFLMTGLGMVAKSKGHSVFLGILGFIGVPGIIILALLKDKLINEPK